MEALGEKSTEEKVEEQVEEGKIVSQKWQLATEKSTELRIHPPT